jgi:CRP/FNR family transcriptional regulator, cyclic AMP receptor protein
MIRGNTMHLPTIDPICALSAVDWLAPAGDTVLQELAAQAVSMHFSDGQLIYRYGQDVGHMLIVASGHIEASMCNAEGKRLVMATVGPGEAAGLIPLMDEQGSINDLTARDELQLLLISRSAWLQTMRAHPELAELVIRLLSRRSRSLYEGVSDRVLFRLEVRLARLLLARSRGRANARIEITQQDLADQLGVSRQSVNLELRRMEHRGWLRIGRASLVLLKPSAIRELTGR